MSFLARTAVETPQPFLSAAIPAAFISIENLLSYLTKQGRIHCINSMYCDTPESVENLDRGLLAAVWVLTEFIDQAEYHTAGDYPAKVIFAAEGDVYEIVYVAEGKEILISNVLKNTGDAPPRYILLVDDPAQIEQLYVPNVGGYCTVTPEGNVQFYQKESIAVTSKAKQLGTWRISNYTPEYRETSGVGRRQLMTMDEVLRMDVDRALVIIRGKKVLEVNKYDYSRHPEAKKLRPSKAASHVPQWQSEKQADMEVCTAQKSATGDAAAKKRTKKKGASATPAKPEAAVPAGQAASLAASDAPQAVQPPVTDVKPASKPKIISASKESILSKPKVNKEE